MKTTLRIAFLFGLCCLLVPFASAGTGAEMKYKIDGSIVIGDQVFTGETLGISMFGHRGMVAVTMDGKRVALMYKSSRGRLQRGVRGMPVLVRDAEGNRHLTGISWRMADNRAVAFSEMRVAAVEDGVATVTPMSVTRRLAAAKASRM